MELHEKKRITLKLEETLSSRGRIRVFKVLSEFGELNVSDIARKTGLNYTATNVHLKALESMGLVREKRFGKIRIYRFNGDDPRAKALRELITFWEKP